MPFPKLVEPGREERAARVETTLPKQTDPNRDTPSHSPPLSLPSPGRESREKNGSTSCGDVEPSSLRDSRPGEGRQHSLPVARWPSRHPPVFPTETPAFPSNASATAQAHDG